MDTGSWWWTGSSGVLQSMGSQRVRHDWATELTLTWFLMELFLHSSLATYWTPTNLAGPSSSVISFCLFILFMGFSRPEYWRALAFPPPVDHVLSGADSQGHALKPLYKASWHAWHEWMFHCRSSLTLESFTGHWVLINMLPGGWGKGPAGVTRNGVWGRLDPLL